MKQFAFSFFILHFSLFTTHCFGQFSEAAMLQVQNPFTHTYSLTIDYTQCGTANTTNFPCLVSLTLANLKTVANGGSVQSVTSGIPNDIVFSSSSNYGSYLKWEVESYNGSTGNLIAWVNVPTLSYTTNTVLYMDVGSSRITTFQGGTTGSVWSSNYLGVWHLGNGTTLNANDYTTNANNGTITGATVTTGAIDGGGNFNGTSNLITASDAIFPSGSANKTISGWYNPATTSGTQFAFGYGTCSTNEMLWVGRNGTGVWVSNYGSAISATGSLSTNTWYHVVVTVSGSTYQCYLNGTAGSSGVLTTNIVHGGSTGMQIGGDCEPLYWNGKIDEVRLRNDIESPSQVTADYNNQKPGSTFIIAVLIY